MSTIGRRAFLAGLCLALSATSAPAESWRVRIQGNGTELAETPVVVALDAPLPPGSYRLAPSANPQQARPAQVFVEGGKPYLCVILKEWPAAASEEFTLGRATSEPATSGIRFRSGSHQALEVTLDDKPLTTYRIEPASKPSFFPVVGPTGVSYTRAYPMESVPGEDRDHNHQRSLWFTHGNVNGVDFWASDPLNPPKPNYGKIVETSRQTSAAGPVVGILRTTDDWLGPDGKKVCEDERVVRFYATSDARVFDFDVALKAANGPVTFGDTKEGMFGLRVASSMDVNRKKGGKITNAEGITDDAAWGKASPWVDYVGPVEDRTVGVAILNHPDSFRYPTTWHVRTYGLFAANPFGWHDFGMKKFGAHTLPAGESLAFRYRVVLHASDTASARVPARFAAYKNPPRVTVTAQ